MKLPEDATCISVHFGDDVFIESSDGSLWVVWNSGVVRQGARKIAENLRYKDACTAARREVESLALKACSRAEKNS